MANPLVNPEPLRYPTETEMYDLIMKEKEEDPKFKRTTFIVTPQASDIPVGCESISEEYIIQVNEIAD